MRSASLQASPASEMLMSQTGRPSLTTQPFGPRHALIWNLPAVQVILVLPSTHAAAPSSSVEHGSPFWLPEMSHETPPPACEQPRGPRHGASAILPFWQTICVLRLRQRASPLSHELPGPGLHAGRPTEKRKTHRG